MKSQKEQVERMENLLKTHFADQVEEYEGASVWQDIPCIKYREVITPRQKEVCQNEPCTWSGLYYDLGVKLAKSGDYLIANTDIAETLCLIGAISKEDYKGVLENADYKCTEHFNLYADIYAKALRNLYKKWQKDKSIMLS